MEKDNNRKLFNLRNKDITINTKIREKFDKIGVLTKDDWVYFKSNISFYFIYSLIVNLLIFYLSKPQSISFIKHITNNPNIILTYIASTIVFLTLGYVFIQFYGQD